MNVQTKPNPTLNTSQKLRHVFCCNGQEKHVAYGTYLLHGSRCPWCGSTVIDVTDAPLGQHYMAFARLDLGTKI